MVVVGIPNTGSSEGERGRLSDWYWQKDNGERSQMNARQAERRERTSVSYRRTALTDSAPWFQCSAKKTCFYSQPRFALGKRISPPSFSIAVMYHTQRPAPYC